MSTSRKRKYKQYLNNPSSSIPKTSAWRYAKSRLSHDANNTEVAAGSTIDIGEALGEAKTVEINRHRRKVYLIDSSVPIPRATLWHKG